MDHAINVVVEQDPSNSGQAITAPPCQRCGKGTVVWSKRRTTPETPPKPKINLADAARAKLRQLIHAARLPHSEFATYALGANEVTVWRYLKGGPIPRERQTFLRNIESITREGQYLHIIVRTVAERPHWRMMERKRELAREPGMADLREIRDA